MNSDENTDENLSGAIEQSPTTSSRRSRTSNVNADASPTARRSIRLRQTSGESSSPMTKRLLHRTNAGGIGSTSSRTGRQSTSTRHGTDTPLSVDRQIATVADADASTNSQGLHVGNIPHQSNVSDPNQSASLTMDVSSDDETPGNESSKNPRSMRSVVLEYFVEEEKGFRCKLCKEVYKASRMSDSNLRLHLGTVHRLQQFLFPSQRKPAPSQDQTVSNERRAELNRAAINCIIDDALPFGAFRRRGMKEFLCAAVPGYIGPDRRTVQRHLSLMYTKHRAILRKILGDISWIALTTDTWMNCRRRRFICLTGHFFTRSFEHVSLVLGFRRVFGRSVATTLRSYIDHEIRRLKIPAHKIISITTDGGSDVRKATATGQFGQPVLCLAHILHLIVTKGLCIWKKPNGQKFPLIEAMDDLWINDDSTSSDGEIDIVDGDDVHNEEQSENGQSTEADTDLSLDDDDDSEPEFDSTNGLATTTNDKDLPDFLLNCYNILARIRSTVKFVRNNSLIHNYVRVQRSIASDNISPSEPEVVLDSRIRWNSTYGMLNRFLSHKDIIKTIVSSPEKIDGITKEQIGKLKTFVFTHDDWDLVFHLHQVLEPFVIATKVLSGRRYPTIGLSMLVCRNLASFLQQNSADDGISSRLKKSLSFHFNYYLNGKVEETQKQYMQIAAFLEPQVYSRLGEDEKRLAKKLIMNKLKSMNFSSINNGLLPSNQQQTTTTSTSTISSGNTSSLSNPHLLDQFEQLCGLTTATTAASQPVILRIPTYDEELSLYVSKAKQCDDFQMFWNKHNHQLPRLSELARRYCLIPASSVASEAAFSRAGYIQRKQRSSLSPKALQHSMLLQDRQLVERLASSLS